MQKKQIKALLIICDILFISLAFIMAAALWYGGHIPGEFREPQSIPPEVWQWLLWICLAATITNFAVLAMFRLYSQLWRYAGLDELLKIFAASIITMLFLFLLDLFLISNIAVLPRRVFVVAWFILFVLVAASRLGERILRRIIVTFGYMLSNKVGLKRVMVVGGGVDGYNLVHSMMHSNRRERLPVIIVDDDPAKNNSHIMGVRIANGINDIPYLAAAYAVDEITVAMPSTDNATLRNILEVCTNTDCRLTMVPPIGEIDEKGELISNNSPREINIGDLLHRDEVKLDTANIAAYIKGACILITGGGSIGSELCRQILRYKPAMIVIIDIYENNAFDLVQELSEKSGKSDKTNDTKIIFRVASIRDMDRMTELFAEFKPNVVFHAAAHKHVSTMEDSPAEAVKNNVFGTLNVVKAAIASEVGRFVLISSDKAVCPTNIYGATKRVTELVMQREALNMSTNKTLLCAVRFGNVLNSSGSIIPKFKRQIAQGGPVTIYSKKAERFFMTISEACQLVLQAASLVNATNNAHIFILDMGKPVNIDSLARKLIRLSGYRPDEDIKLLYTKLPPGEKLSEELILPEEKGKLQLTHHNKIWLAAPVIQDYSQFDMHMETLRKLSTTDPKKISQTLKIMGLHYE
ncbi:MAG: polysaccharide biosynthesis protein [Defluviitaleaceae bacterium]|nr:polysaccharide biosynthesis protein [Defluviitaleaceae bacterium]